MIRKFFLFILLLIAGAVIGLYFLQDQELEIALTEKDLRGKIEEVFPIEESYLLVVRLRLSDPEVDLDEGSDRITYQMRAKVSLAGHDFGGSARVSGTIRYEAEKREFYLDDSRLEDLDIDGVSAEYREPLRGVANLAAREVFEKNPVYVLDEEFLGKLGGTVAVRQVKVVDGKLRISFGLADQWWKRFLPL